MGTWPLKEAWRGLASLESGRDAPLARVVGMSRRGIVAWWGENACALLGRDRRVDAARFTVS